MNVFNQVTVIAVSDYRERMRRFSFLVALGLTLLAGYLFMPPFGSSYTAFIINDHRGFYNSSWVGILFGVTSATLLSLIGFYVVRTSVGRDYDTRVGQIIASSPVANSTYLVGKWLSNLMMLASLLVVLSVIAPVMQLVRAEDTHINLIDLWMPIWVFGIPALAFISALAILFETVRFLRGVWGNVIFFFLWSLILIGASAAQLDSDIEPIYALDFSGMTRISSEVTKQLVALGVDVTRGTCAILGSSQDPAIRFDWQGMPWTLEILLERLLWVGFAFSVAMLAALPFDRFNSMGTTKKGFLQRLFNRKTEAVPEHQTTQDHSVRQHITLTSITNQQRSFSFLHLLTAELQLMLKGYSIWWYVAILGLNIAIPLVPSNEVAQLLFAIASLLPVAVWSAMGNREMQHQTYLTIFSTANLSRRQLPALWLSGILVAVLTGFGFLLRILVTGQTTLLFPFVIGAVFISSLALALGVWTNGRRVFEVVYLLIWYISIQDGATPFDYRGASDAAYTTNVYLFYLIAAVVLTVLSIAGRQKQLRAV